MQLDDAQKQKVAEWLNENRSISEIQDLLKSDLGIALTYMEVRFLVDDLGLELKDPEPEPEADSPAADEAAPAAGEEPGGADAAAPDDSGDAGSKVRLTVDKVVRPGAIVSGKAIFSDGKSAEWMLDQMGRLGLVPEEEGYKASEDDIAEFQIQLQEELRRMGF